MPFVAESPWKRWWVASICASYLEYLCSAREHMSKSATKILL
jgi:hypothetical protein